MSNIESWAERNIVSYKGIIAGILLLCFLLLMQALIVFGVRSSTTAWEGACSFREWKKGSDGVGVVIDCGTAGKGSVYGSEVILSYLVNPGPLQCRIDVNGDIRGCDVRPALPDKKQ